MSFCKFSPNFTTNNKTAVDNVFISDYLPKAPDMCVKAYLLGLFMCNNAEISDNSLEYFANTLKICEDDVVSLFKYWEDLGLVQVLSTNPIEVRYLPITSSNVGINKFKVDKYTDFNIQVQELFGKRMVMPNEYAEFYNLIERHHFEEKALIAIIKYCVEYKGFNLSPNYCLTVAKDWEREGIRNIEQVEEKIQELGIVDDQMSLILSAMGSKRKIQIEDKELLNRWLNSYGFDLNVIIFVVKLLKNKKHHFDINSLDEQLTKYYEMKTMSIQEIENYENEKENLFNVAVTINKELGLFYEDLTKEIDTYVVSWLNMGFDLETLKTIADNCFKSSVKTLEGFNNVLNKLFKLGIVNINSYNEYLRDNLAIDEKIKEVLVALNMSRNVNAMDRNFYNIWTNEWGFPHEVILHGASISKDRINAMPYLNKVLANWNSQGFKTLDKVKSFKAESNSNNSFSHQNYTKEQISSLISGLGEIEV